MSSELELTRYGRESLARAFEEEHSRRIVEIPPKMQPLPEVVAVLANEERRLKAACRRRA